MESDHIRASTVSCEALISSCLSAPKLAEDGWARDRLDDLKLWSSGISATAGGHASLEWRLRSRPDIKEVILGFLDVLQEKIQECLQHSMTQTQKSELVARPASISQGRGSDSRSSSSSGSLSPWSELPEDGMDETEHDESLMSLKYSMKGVETTLAQLARISLVIRKAGAQLRHQRADNALQSSLSNYDSFKQRLEFLFIWNPYQEDISPYHQLLFRHLTSNETQKNLCPGIHTWPGSPSPSSPGPDAINIDKWRSVYEWILSLDTSSASEEPSNQLHDLGRAYSLPATLSLRYKRDDDLPNPVLITAHEPEAWQARLMIIVLTDPRRLTNIQNRLIQANIKRRHRLEFARNKTKPTKRIPEKEPPVVKPIPKPMEPAVIPLPAVPALPRCDDPLKPAQSKPSIAAKSILSVTELGVQEVLDFKAPSSSVITRVSSTGQKLKYPPRPKISGDRTTFECHYCCQVLPRVYGEQGWRGHIMQDLQPYSCVLEDCPTPDDLYGSRKDWETHMQKIHSADKWICYVCPQSPQTFVSAAEYESHLRQSPIHADTFTEAQLPFLVEDGRTPTIPDFLTCPLCNWSERHAEFDELPSQQSQIHNAKTTNIQDHVAEHLHSFALQALPDLNEGDADSRHTSVGSVENNLKILLASDDVAPLSFDDNGDERMHVLWRRLFNTFAGLSRMYLDDSQQNTPEDFSPSSVRNWLEHWGKTRRVPPPFWTSVLASDVNDSIWALDECGRALDAHKAQRSPLEPTVLRTILSNVSVILSKLMSGYQSARSAAARRRFRVLVTVVQACGFLDHTSTLNTVNDLGKLAVGYYANGQVTEAVKLLEQVVADTYNLSTETNANAEHLRLDERLLPAYQNCLLDVYTDFIEYCIDKSHSLDILLRHWVPSEKRGRLSTTLSETNFAPQVNKYELPTWIPLIQKSFYGTPAQWPQGRPNGDSFVGTPIRSSVRNYSATLNLLPEKEFRRMSYAPDTPKRSYTKKYSGILFVRGLRIGIVEKITQRAAQGMLFKESFELAGFDHERWQECQEWAAETPRVPEGFWRTIVADRGPDGVNPPSWYPRACFECLHNIRPNGDLNPHDVIGLEKASSIAKLFLKRVKDVVWERLFVRIQLDGENGKATYGLAPKETKEGDIVCVFFGCSVPVILRQQSRGEAKHFHMIGECFVYGMMDGEAVASRQWAHPYDDAEQFQIE